MRKIRRIYGTTQEINFISPQKKFLLYWKSFQQAESGRIYQTIPWFELAKVLKINEKRKGPCGIFSLQGILTLMFLKSYYEFHEAFNTLRFTLSSFRLA
jgi:hypothetical protein